MGRLLVNKIRGMNSLTVKGVLLLWAFLLSFACLVAPRSAEAAVTALTGNAWRTTSGTAISATAYFRGTTTVPGATNTYAIASGPNRLLVVVLSINASAAQNSRIPTVKYGLAGSENQTLTLATSDQATSSRQHTWVFYLKEAGIAAANGTNLSFTYTGTTPTYTGTYANAAVYQNVDQTTPILTPTTFNSGATANTAVGPLATSQVVATGDLALEMVNVLNTAAATAPTITYDATPAAWTSANTTTRTGTTPAAYGATFAVRTIATAGTHDSTHASSVNALDSMSAVTLKAGPVDTTKPTVTAFSAPTSSDTVTISPITLTASDDSGTIAGYLINESATPPTAAAITSAVAPTSYTVSGGGTKTLYAWVKDPSGNVSAAFAPQAVVVTVPSPPARFVNWTQTYAAASYPPAGAAGNFTVPAGSNRLLVVAIASTSTAVGAQTVSNVTWGGKTMTLAAGDAGTSVWNHTYLYYLKEADIAAASGTAITATIAGGTAYYTYVYAAVYTGVDQTNPVPSAVTYTSSTLDTNVGPFAPTLTVDPFHQAIEIVNLARSAAATTARTVSTWAAPWNTAGVAPTGIATTGPTLQLYIRDRAVPAVVTNDPSLHVCSSANTFKAMTAMSIRYASSGVNLTTGATIPNKSVYAGDLSVPVDAFTLQTTVADTVTSLQLTASAASTNTNVTALRIYRKVGTNPAIFETGDQIVADISNPFAGGTTITVPLSGAGVIFTAADARNYIVVYDIAAGASPSSTGTLSASVTAIAVTNPGTLSDTPVANSGVITILPTTTIANGDDTAPNIPAARLYKSSTLTKLDEFILSHNSGQTSDDDTLTTTIVTLSPPGISGGGPVNSKVSRVEIVGADNTLYGFMTAPTTGDIWNIPTPALVATNVPKTYYIRIATPAIIVDGLYTVRGTVTSVVHSKGANKLVNGDSSSQTLTIDVEAPNGPASLTATTPPDAPPPGGGKIDLSWGAATDPNSGALHATTPYLVVRSKAGGTDPAPFCTVDSLNGDVLLPVGTATSYTDSGLNDTQAPIYHYRVCAKDALGNINYGVTASKASSYSNYCSIAPDVTLGSEDPLNASLIQDQIIKSVDKGGTTTPFLLQVTNNDIGTCPNVEFNIAIVGATTAGGSGTGSPTDPFPSIADFEAIYPAKVTLGKAISKTSSTEKIFINGLNTADQIQKYIFRVQVSAAAHPTVYNKTSNETEAFATGILNDMPPIVHNANNMAKYQYGTWGNTYTCATCHSNSTTNIKGVYELISTPIGRRNVVFNRISGTNTDTDVYSNDQRANKNGSNNVCSVCHHRTRQHQYSASKPNGGPTNDVPYTSDHHNNRDCVKCHTHNTAFKSILGVCGDCHGFKGTKYSPINKATMVKSPPTNALGTNPPSYGAHQRHNTAQMSCAVCHSNTNHGLDTTVWQGDDKMEIGFKIDNTTFPGYNPAPGAAKTGGAFEGTDKLNAPYSWIAAPDTGTTITLVGDSNASCSTYCHGGWLDNDGNPNQGSNTKPNWVGTGQAACGSCHNASAPTPPTSGSHKMHAGSGTVRSGVTGLGIGCEKCHSTYVSYTGSAHINGNVEWNLSQISPSALYNNSNGSATGAPAPTPKNAYGACNQLYCHSTVQGENGVGAPTYAAPQWGDNGTSDIIGAGASATAYCGSCHVYPNTAGGHEQHEALEFSFACQTCHNNGGRTSPLNHANGKINFEFAGLGVNTVYKGISTSGSVTPQSGYGTCSNSDCHGRFTRRWQPPSTLSLCDKCHGSRTSDRGFYNTRGPDGTLSIYSAAVGVHDIHLQNPNSPRKATFSRFTSFAAGMNCNQCHYVPTGPFTAGHMDTPLPAEVPFAHTSSIADKGKHDYAYSQYSTPTYNQATQSCSNVWCHGGGMASNTSKGKYAGTTPGIARKNPVWNEPLLNSGNPCTKCHAMPPPAPDSSYTHWNIGANRVYNLQECVGCHQHLNANANGFVDKSLHINGVVNGGCTGCHGDPPTTGTIGPETGLATPVQNAMSSGRAGAHAIHIANASIKKNCYTCHYNYNPIMPSDKLELGFSAYGGKVVSGTFTGYSSPQGGANWSPTNAGTVITVVADRLNANVCSNLYCHGSTITDGGTNKSPNWEKTGEAVCGTCHGADPTSVPFPALPGAHTRHASSNNGGLQIACGTCHGASVQSMAHVNGTVDWELDQNNPKIGTTARYRGYSTGTTTTLAPSASYGQCTSFYCHSNVQGAGGIGDPTQYQPMTWGSNVTLNCGSCHNDQVTAGTASHTAHTSKFGGATACGYCHHGAGDGTELHADRMIYVNITTSRLGAGVYTGSNRDAGSAAGYGNCTNIICHGGASLKWGANLGTKQCQKCHGSKTAVDAQALGNYSAPQIAPGFGSDGQDTAGNTAASSKRVGAHQRHLSSNAVTNRVKCSECHVKVTNVLDNGHLNYTTATITFTGRATGNGDVATPSRNAAGVITCSTTWCHTAKNNTGTKMVPVWTDSAYLNETGTTVGDCVACHAIPPKGVGITDHDSITTSTSDALSTLATKCNGCHKDNFKPSPANAGDVFVDRSMHVNGIIDATGGHVFPFNGYTHAKFAAPITNCTSCHSNTGSTGYPVTAGTKPDCRACHTKGSPGTGCNSCHGSLATASKPDGNVFPNISGSHTKHVVGKSMACSDCHDSKGGGAVGDRTHGPSNRVAHNNTFVNVTSASGRQFSFSWSGGTGKGTCSNVACHGTAEWGVTKFNCLTCHAQSIGARAAVTGQFASQSHHVQGSELPLTTADCAKCHWEANTDGSTNPTYHSGTSGKGVSLVVWKTNATTFSTTRPTTVNAFNYVSYTANGSRPQIAKLNDHCLGCHNSTPKAAADMFGVFATDQYSPEAKLATPKAKTSILSRYSSQRVVSWSSYAFTNSSGQVVQYGTNAKKTVTKALSAHGNASKNQMRTFDATLNGKGDEETGADFTYTGTSANRNVFCYDCHNSHGSDAAGVTSSYSSATGRYNGGLLKSTVAGKGGYNVTYKPQPRTINYKNYSTTATTAATFYAGASICNDCHNSTTIGSKEAYKNLADNLKPWTINGTYSSSRSIVGYWSTPYFDNYTVYSVKRSPYKGGAGTGVKDYRKPMGGHFGSSVNGTSAAHNASTYGGQYEINGLCTPCHDPHGVSNALGTNRDHGVPLLKGSWVTSPYREDRARPTVVRGGGRNVSNFGLAGAPAGYNIDQNTFFNLPAPVGNGAAPATTRQNMRAQAFVALTNNALTPHLEKTPADFAGLCMECHSQAALTNATAPAASNWRTKERVHQSVAGWAATTGSNTGNAIHAYTCSKCHTPHVSRLPRLMVTNCLDQRHASQSATGRTANGISISTTAGTTTATFGNILQSTATSSALGAGRFPGGGARYSGTPASAQNPGGWWFQTAQQTGAANPTTATEASYYGSNCHNATNAGGATWNPTNQRWNKKTPW